MDVEMMKRNRDMHQERTRMENKGGECWRRFLWYEPQLFFGFFSSSSEHLRCFLYSSLIYMRNGRSRRLWEILRHTHALKLICVSCYIIQDAICQLLVLLSFNVGVTFQNKPEGNAKSQQIAWQHIFSCTFSFETGSWGGLILFYSQ